MFILLKTNSNILFDSILIFGDIFIKMKLQYFVFGLLAILTTSGLFAQNSISRTDENGNSYTAYENDPTNSRWYTLENGLTVILAENKTKPRVQTLIATKAGSSSDPADNTGLAHYLEHMLFKGTDTYGTLDFEKEKVLLDEIDELYEQYNSTKDEAKRKEIYQEIDRVSGEAAKYAIANEYDKMLQGIGASGTNAFTSFERTVYVNDIPANQINTWLDIEAERFRKPVLRLFHTELEAVYEEKNRALDSDGRLVYERLFAEAFPNHNYGRQTTIGTIEHLKNPSLKKIRNYYNSYYVPNNMAIILAGDLDAASTFKAIQDKFSYMKAKEVDKMVFENEEPLKETKRITVNGPSAESLTIGYRVPSALSKEVNTVRLIDLILANSKAGLIDLNIVKKQKALSAGCSPFLLKDRGLHYFSGRPLEGQSLEELENLFYTEINKLKSGDFDMDLVKSIILNQKVDKIKQFESYQGTAYALMDAFVMNNNWSAELAALDAMLLISKDDLIAFAKKYYTDGHIVIYKRKGELDNKVKIEKPAITKVEVNRGKTSPFVTDILGREIQPIAPQILDYKKDIVFDALTVGTKTAAPIWKVKEGDEQLFDLYYVLDMGSYHDQKLALAVRYLQYLGTKDKTAEDISKAFYALACDFGVSAGSEQSYVYLTGLASSFEEALALFEELLAEAIADEEQLNQLITRTLKGRADAKLNKRSIQGRLRNYALYGANNPSRYLLSEEELKMVRGEELVSYIHKLTSYPHKIWYNGPLSMGELKKVLTKYHKLPTAFEEVANPVEFKLQDKEQTTVYFADYDMVQAEVMWLKKSNEVDVKEAGDIAMFNEYFGGGMSSIVFQEIRESKALAYSTYSFYAAASKLGDHNVAMAYVGTQADKLEESLAAMNELLTELPLDEGKFENGKSAIKQNLASSRTLKMSVLFSYDQALKMGMEEDRRKLVAERIENISLSDVNKFHQNKMKGGYTYAVLGSEDRIDFSVLEKYGEVKKLSLEELFGY
jgi:predicted Zn-dependent peptidase